MQALAVTADPDPETMRLDAQAAKEREHERNSSNVKLLDGKYQPKRPTMGYSKLPEQPRPLPPLPPLPKLEPAPEPEPVKSKERSKKRNIIVRGKS